MIRVLFLAANPQDQAHLRVRQEFDAVQQALDAAKDGARFQLIQEFAATPKQLQALLFRHTPQIVHFSGHGTDAGLLFENEEGVGQPVAAATLRDLFTGFQQIVRCVVLNACYSQSQAAAIGTVIDAVVGMGDVVSDEAALAFAGAFYRALANGTTLGQALALGHNQLDLEELATTEKPQLAAARLDAERVRALDWEQSLPIASTTALQTINTGGGSNIGGGVTAGGNVAGRDYIGEQHIHYHGETPLALSGSPLGARPITPRGLFGLYPFNEHFFGRDDELATLHTLLQSAATVSICPTITGMGGLGKTQLAAHYARAHIADYPDGIFWITAADLNSIRPQLADFCVTLNLPVADPQRTGDLTEQKLSAFKAYLDEHPQALLILDNVAEPDHLRTRQIGVGFTALTLGSKVLVTTRRRKLPSDRFAELPLERLLPAPARQILTTARPDLATDPDLVRLCAQFGYLPLMLNLAAAALKKRGGAIAGYLQKLQEWGIDTLHDRAKVSLADYHTSLTAVLQEQWAMLTSEDARLLLRVAGQLPEAEVIPTARLGLLAGLQDVDEWECPLRDGLEGLERVSLVEVVDGVTVGLHPLIRDFAESLTTIEEHEFFRIACAGRLASAFYDMQRLGLMYEQRGISAMIFDLLAAIDLCYVKSAAYILPDTYPPRSRPSNKGALTSLHNFLHIFRYNAHHLQGPPQSWRAERLWQQLLPRTPSSLTLPLDNILSQTLHWLPHWKHERQSLALEQTLTGHQGSVNGVAVVDSNRIVSTSWDGTLKVWNLQSCQVEQTLSGHEGKIRGVAVVNPNCIVSASDDRTLKVWNLQTGQVENTLSVSGDWDQSVAVVDSNRVVSASSDCTLTIWNLQTGQVEQVLSGHDDWVNSVAVVDPNCIISASDDRTLKMWNLQTGQVEQTFIGHESYVNSVAVVDAKRIVSASNDCTLKVWNLQSGQVQQTLTGHNNWVLDVAVVDGNRIVSASSDRTLKVWNLQTGQVEQTFIGHEFFVNGVVVIGAKRIVSASNDRTLKVWNLQTDQVEQTFTGYETFVTRVAVVDPYRIVSVSNDRTLKVWNLQSGLVEQTLSGHEDYVLDVAVIDPNHIVSASDDYTLKVWNLRTGQVKQILTGHQRSVLGVAMLDANRIVSASSDRTLKVWNLETGQVEQTFSAHEASVLGVAMLDTNRIVSASSDHALKVWNLQTHQVEQILTGHEESVWSVLMLNPQRIVSASKDRTLKVWNLQTGQVEHTLSGHEDSVNGVAVVDANRIVSASDDRTLKVWNLQTGQIIASVGLDGALTCVAVTRQNGRTLVVAGDAGGALYCLELVEPVGQ